MNAVERILMTIGCVDCAAVPKAADAGRIFRTPDGFVRIMHNGPKVVEGVINLAQHDAQESFRGDDRIVAGFQPRDGNVILPAISRNMAQNSSFPEL